MAEKDRYDMKKLPAGMTYASVRAELDKAYRLLQTSAQMTDDMEAAFRYVGRLVVDAEVEHLHSGIPQKPPV